MPSMNIHILNCNSLNNKLSEIKDHLYNTNSDILCLCKTWLTERFTLRFNNNCSGWINRPGRVGGGLGVLVHRELRYDPLPILPFPAGVFEVQGLSLNNSDKSVVKLLNI